MIYELSRKRPSVVTGKTLKLRKKLPGVGRKIKSRPNPVYGVSKGVLPAMMRAGRLRLPPGR